MGVSHADGSPSAAYSRPPSPCCRCHPRHHLLLYQLLLLLEELLLDGLSGDSRLGHSQELLLLHVDDPAWTTRLHAGYMLQSSTGEIR